jgi:hypothetical protein
LAGEVGADEAPAGAPVGRAATGVGLADGAGAGPLEPEPVPVAPGPFALAGEPADEPEAADEPEPVEEPKAAEATADEAEPTTEAAGEAADVIAEVAGDVAELTAEVTGDVAEPTVEATAEAADVCVDVRGGSAAVAAWAGRENSSMTAKIPAAASAACIAARAMRRTIGCTMSSSHSTRNRAARLPSGGGSKLACPHLLFGHHRTVSASIGQGRSDEGERSLHKGPMHPGSPTRPSAARSSEHVVLYQERRWLSSNRSLMRTRHDIEQVLVETLMGTNHSRQSGGERVNVLDLSRWQFGVTTVRYFAFTPIAVGTGFPVSALPTART